MGNNHFGEIVQRAELESIAPIAMSAIRGATEVEGKGAELSIEHEHTHQVLEDGAELRVTSHYTVTQETESNGTPFSAQVAYVLTYRFDPPLGPEHEEAMELFAEHNGRYNSWSYLRAYLARVTGEFGLPTIPLPLLKPFSPSLEAWEKAKSIAETEETSP